MQKKKIVQVLDLAPVPDMEKNIVLHQEFLGWGHAYFSEFLVGKVPNSVSLFVLAPNIKFSIQESPILIFVPQL